jgi:hypothetical protein
VETVNLFWCVVFFMSIPDLIVWADAVADWTRPGRHAVLVRTGHAALRVR